jgi:hypothetical protein
VAEVVEETVAAAQMLSIVLRPKQEHQILVVVVVQVDLVLVVW